MTIDLSTKEFKCCQIVHFHTVQVLVSQLEEYLNSQKQSSQELLAFLDYTENLLHDNHYLRLIAKRYLSQLLPPNDARKVGFCRQLLAIFDTLDPGLSQSRGLTLFELYKVTQEREIASEIIKCLEMEPKLSLAGKACEMLRQKDHVI